MKKAIILGEGIAAVSLTEMLCRNGYQCTILSKSEGLGKGVYRTSFQRFSIGVGDLFLKKSERCRDLKRNRQLLDEMYSEYPEYNKSESKIFLSKNALAWFSTKKVYYILPLYITRHFFKSLLWLVSVIFNLVKILFTETSIVSFPLTLNGVKDSITDHSLILEVDDLVSDSKNILSTLLMRSVGHSFISCDYEVFNSPTGDVSVKYWGQVHTPELVVSCCESKLPNYILKIGWIDVLLELQKSYHYFYQSTKPVYDIPNFSLITPDQNKSISCCSSDSGLQFGSEKKIIGENISEKSFLSQTSELKDKILDITLNQEVFNAYLSDSLVSSRGRKFFFDRKASNCCFAYLSDFQHFPSLVNEMVNELCLVKKPTFKKTILRRSTRLYPRGVNIKK